MMLGEKNLSKNLTLNKVEMLRFFSEKNMKLNSKK